MSLTSKLTFAGSLLSSVGIVAYIYYKQNDDRQKLHAGIMRDVERQEQKKLENLYILEQQQELTKKLRAREQLELEAQGIQSS